MLTGISLEKFIDKPWICRGVRTLGALWKCLSHGRLSYPQSSRDP